MPVNGNYAPHQGYGGLEQQNNNYAYGANMTASQQPAASAPAPPSTAGSTTSQAAPAPSKDEVGWYFVEQYYTTLSRNPEKVYLFYNKRSQFVSGQETDKVAVCVGQRAINDRIKELEFQDTKVRVTNVDSQASDLNIVIQVIGEISNKSQPHRKFVQTFILATQTNGYFVLNDIFRYLIDEEDEPEQESASAPQEEIQQVPAAESGVQEPPSTMEETEPKTLTSSEDPKAVENDAQKVDKQLEEQASTEVGKDEETSSAAVNGVDSAAEDLKPTEHEPAATPEPVVTDAPRRETKDVDLQPEKPQDPEPTPIASPPKQATPAPASKPAAPAVPKTWASLAASANRVATPAAPSSSASSQTSQQPKAAPAAKPTATTTPSAPSAPAAPTAPAAQREESPAASSQDEWTAVGSSHNRQQSRLVNQQQQGPNTRGYIKNVYESVKDEDLKAQLERFGEVTYCDIARQKVCPSPTLIHAMTRRPC